MDMFLDMKYCNVQKFDPWFKQRRQKKKNDPWRCVIYWDKSYAN